MRATPDNSDMMMQRQQNIRRMQMQRANLRSALFDNVQTRPTVSENHRLFHGQMSAPPPYRIPLEHSVKPLPTLPYIVGNHTYNPDMEMNPVETPGTSFIRDKLMNSRIMQPMLRGGVGEPSKTNPTVL
jgi:hypothetical protein